MKNKASTVQKQVNKVLIKHLGLQYIRENDLLIDLAANKEDITQISADLEREFGIILQNEELDDGWMVKGIYLLIEQKLKNKPIIRPTKNGDFIIRGERADVLDLTRFKTAAEMTDWELGDTENASVYDVYDASGQIDLADHLSDVFGTEFADAFYKHKEKLRAIKRLAEVRAEIAELRKIEQRLQETIDS